MKRFVVASLIVALFTGMSALSATAQSDDEGIRLYNEALKIYNSAQTHADMKRAVEKFQEALRIFERTGFKKGIAVVSNSLGIAHKNCGQSDKAVSCFEKSLVMFRALNDSRREGHTLNNMGLVLVDLGKYDKALAYYGKALVIFRALKDGRGEGSTLNNMGNVYSYWGQYDKAVAYFEKSLVIFGAWEDRRGEGKTLNNLGAVYRQWGQYDKAVCCFENSLAIRRALKDRPGEGKTLNNLGNVYKNWGKYDKALSYYTESLAIKRQLKDHRGEGQTLNNLGSVFADRGQYEKAKSYFQKSLDLRKRLKDRRGEGEALNNLGTFFTNLGQYDKAERHYKKALKKFEELRDPRKKSTSLVNLGRVRQHRRAMDDALSCFEEAAKLLTDIGVAPDLPKKCIAYLYMDEGEYQKAAKYVRQTGSFETDGRLSLLTSDFRKALESYRHVMNAAKESRDIEELFIGHTGMGLASEGLGKHDEATEHFNQATKLTEQVRSRLTELQRQAFLDVQFGGFRRTEPYEGLARVLHRMEKPTESLRTSEYTKARAFAESMPKLGKPDASDVPPKVRKQDEQIRNQLAAHRQRLQEAHKEKRKLTIAALEQQIEKLEKEFAEHKKMLRKKYRLFAATKYPEPMNLAHTALKDDEWVLSLDVTDPGVLIYLTKGKKLVKSVYNDVPRKVIDELVKQFRAPFEYVTRDNLYAKLEAFDFKAGKRLYDILLGEVVANIPKGVALIVVPDDSVGAIPFEMLVLNHGGQVKMDKPHPYVVGAQFFGDRNPISYYQSITALTLARTFATPRNPGNRLLVIDNPEFGTTDKAAAKPTEGEKNRLMAPITRDKLMSAETDLGIRFDPLPETAELGSALQKEDPKQTDRFTSLNATKANFMNADHGRYRSMVFATHGYFGTNLPGIQEPALVLTLVNQPEGTDGFLRMSEVMSLRPKITADVVALTACKTGVGRQVSGEGVMSMGRAFQYAGAKSVLMSLWSVAGKTSTDMTQSFFKHLKSGKSRLEALRLARKEIRKAGYDHPYYWAPFILVGEVTN